MSCLGKLTKSLTKMQDLAINSVRIKHVTYKGINVTMLLILPSKHLSHNDSQPVTNSRSGSSSFRKRKNRLDAFSKLQSSIVKDLKQKKKKIKLETSHKDKELCASIYWAKRNKVEKQLTK